MKTNSNSLNSTKCYPRITFQDHYVGDWSQVSGLREYDQTKK